MSPVDYFEFLAGGKKIGKDDQALLWKLKRRLDHTMTSGRIPPNDMETIRAIVLSQLKSKYANRDVIVQEWLKIEGAQLKWDPKKAMAINKSLQDEAYRLDPEPIFSGLSEISRGTSLEHYVAQEWLPSLLKDLKSDIGDRALERCLFSSEPQIRQFAAKVLAERESMQLPGRSGPYVRALRQIQALNGDWASWLRSTPKSGEEAQAKAAYLALHPEYRSRLSESELRAIEPAFAKFSNLSVFEELAGGRLPTDAKSESFEFNSYDFPAGGKRVQLGSPDNEFGRDLDESLHEVTFTKPFEMQVTPVTQLQWSLVMGENPSKFKSGGSRVKISGRDIEMYPNRPVESVSWNDAQKFIEKLNQLDTQYNYRLPTEAEWEYAARAESDSPFIYGSDPHATGYYGWYVGNSGNQTRDVAEVNPNLHGLYDMPGNVWEWVHDKWIKNRPAHAVDPQGPGLLSLSTRRVLRGGSWSSERKELRSAQRDHNAPGKGNEEIGFRLVRTLKATDGRTPQRNSWMPRIFR